ncbi:MAG: electron transfer flavoprotein subunit beta/FixA family protein [Propionibacteriaceae bacterium]|nr:electron transfer flavoprotein subunit beta/FixA family protein [Propionibacteriaceae bacterium]
MTSPAPDGGGTCLNILVLVKQVPNTQAIKIDPETNTLIRDGVESILNPYDSYALEAATRLKDKLASIKISVLTMGPARADVVLRECMAISADAAYLVTDRRFGGSDTLATSYILSQAIRFVQAQEGRRFDLIFCGKQAIDGDTGQVGPQVAELLDLPQVTSGLACELAGDELLVVREMDDGTEKLALPLPGLVTFTKPNYSLRPPSARRKLAAKKLDITTISADDLEGIDRGRIGLKGSPTRVRKAYVPPAKTGGVIFSAQPIEESVRQLAQLLVDRDLVVNVEGDAP